MRKVMGKGRLHGFSAGDIAGLILIALSIITSLGLFTGAQTPSNASVAVLGTVCKVFNTVKSVIFILGLTLMLLGAALYSGANLMPSQSRGPIQGYGMSMIIGGVVGTAIAVSSPFILNTVVKASGANTTAILTNSSFAFNGQGGSPASLAASVCSNLPSQGNYYGGDNYSDWT